MLNRRKKIIKYLIADYFAALIAWMLLFTYRKYDIESDFDFLKIFEDPNIFIGMAVIPIAWILFYALSSFYTKVYRKSRLKELGMTAFQSLVGTLFVFFIVILDDYITDYTAYYRYYFMYLLLQFFLTFIGRFFITTSTVNAIQSGKIGYNTLIIGSNGRATSIYHDIINQSRLEGNKFVGFVKVQKVPNSQLSEFLPCLGDFENINEIIEKHQIEEIIIAIDPQEHKYAQRILTVLENSDLVIKIIPDMRDILLGKVKMSAIFHTPLIQIQPELMVAWQRQIKRAFDIVASISALIVLFPVFVFIAIVIKATSEGPIFYTHERIGKNGKAFRMHKFRSMKINAEVDGPQLSSDDDPRITKFGKFMRKVRLDETPQFWNVLKGDMSIVGYRPERQYFIDQITEKAPHYKLLLRITPGITSWGQVKYGYAVNVDEMVERLKYDILYVENMSIATDIKILIYTVIIVFKGRGK